MAEQTFQALEEFIQTQRNLIARQRSDIKRLQKLKLDLHERPSEVLENLSEELDDNAFRLSEQGDCRLEIPKGIDWSVFAKADTGPLQTFVEQARDKIARRNCPSPHQHSELSELQILVKEARRTIFDPAMSRFAPLSSPEPQSEDEIDPVELKRQQEQQKLRELKKRKIRSSGLSLPLSRHSGSIGVFIPEAVKDEAMNVDVTIDDEERESGNLDPAGPIILADGDPPGSANAAPSVRRKKPPSLKRKKIRISQSKLKITVPSKSKQLHESENEDDPDPTPKATKMKKKSEKPKPETYKQAWSVSEQNLLEQLLEEIPDGEKFRWQRISIAMGGRRTPRQVASRVQKYFEQLKKYGVLLDGANS